MNRRRRASVARPTMFPFLSVLVCMIGTLMFLAVAVGMSSLQSASANVALEIMWDQSHATKKPLILECTSEGARDVATGTVYKKENEPEDKLAQLSGTPYTDLLNELSAKRDREYLMFIVRPSGLDAFAFLRSILVLRNKQKCRAEVSLAETPNPEAVKQLPQKTASRMTYENGTLSFLRKMTPEMRDQIKGLFQQETSKNSVDELYSRSQQSTEWIDYGTELIPAEWNFQAADNPNQTTPSS